MKTIPLLLLSIALTFCAPTPPSPPPKPPPAPLGVYTIMEFDAPGHVIHEWTNVKTFTETQFPRTVTFSDSSGKVIILQGSYQIDEVKP